MRSYYIDGIPILYPGNYGNSDTRTNILPEGTVMRKVRLIPQAYTEHICLRWQVMGALAASGKYVFKLHVVVVLIWITGSYIAVEARIVRSSVS